MSGDRHFSRKSCKVSFVWGALPKYKTCIYLSQTVQYNPNMSKTATWAHKQYSSYIPTMNPTISNSYKSSNIFYSYTIHILKLEVSIHVYIINQATTQLSSNPQSLGRAVPSHAPYNCKIVPRQGELMLSSGITLSVLLSPYVQCNVPK